MMPWLRVFWVRRESPRHCADGASVPVVFFVVVDSGDLLHVGLRQGEVEDVEVVAEVLRAAAARHGDDAALQVPAQDDLRRTFAVSLRDAVDGCIAEHRGGVPPPSERIPGFDGDAAVADGFDVASVLIIGVDFILHERRRAVDAGQEVAEGVLVVVRRPLQNITSVITSLSRNSLKFSRCIH